MSFHSSTQTTPFETVYGRPPPTLFRYVDGEVQCAAVQRDLVDRDEALKQLKFHLERAQAQMQTSANKHRRDVSFEVGEWVYLKLRPHRQQSVIRRIHQKLAARFYGPFLITAKVGEVAYRLQLPATAKIHPVFHVSLLKKAVKNATVEPELPRDLSIDSESDHFPVKCLATRTINKDGARVTQWLIQWNSCTTEDATWEDSADVQRQFPNFQLEDKLHSQEAAIDTSVIEEPNPWNEQQQPTGPKTGPWIVYSRRPRGGNSVSLLEGVESM